MILLEEKVGLETFLDRFNRGMINLRERLLLEDVAIL
jgi:hypothetical protein